MCFTEYRSFIKSILYFLVLVYGRYAGSYFENTNRKLTFKKKKNGWLDAFCLVMLLMAKQQRGELFILTASVDHKTHFTAAESLMINKVDTGVSFWPHRPLKLAHISIQADDCFVFKANLS